MTFNWTQDRVDVLRELFKTGMSFSKIADAIAKQFDCRLTRNAIIGKIHRLTDLPRRNTDEDRLRARLARLAAPPKERVARTKPPRPRRSPKPRTKPTGWFPWSLQGSKPGALPEEAAPPPQARMLSLNALPYYGACKYPIGDPREPGFGFCGQEQFPNQVYCAYHCRLAYRDPYRNETPERIERLALLG